MIKKWIKVFRQNLSQSDIDPDQYTDQEILEIAKGFMAPVLCKQEGIQHYWIFELYWIALLLMDPDKSMKGGININMFENRANKSQN